MLADQTSPGEGGRGVRPRLLCAAQGRPQRGELNAIRELGFVDGDKAAKALLATQGGIAQANNNQKRLAKAAAVIGNTAGLAKYGITAGAARGLQPLSTIGGIHVHIPPSSRHATLVLIDRMVHRPVAAAMKACTDHITGQNKR